MPHGRLLACAFLVLATALLGCSRDLGECNLDGTTPDPDAMIEGPAALDIAYRLSDGLPMYEGQALVQSTCGNGAFCHAPLARGADRYGAPAGLNFDVSLVCTGPVTDCETNPPYDDRISRLQGEQNNIRNWAEGMMQELHEGAMPPGEAGRRVRSPATWLRADDEEPLPSIESKKGKEIVRNWLACQAPVVGRTETAPSPAQELESCGSANEEITCIYSGPAAELPDPNWRDIYWTVMFIQCVGCHGPANNNVDQNPDNLGGDIPGGASPAALAVLDLTGSNVSDTSNWPDESYGAVVDVSTSTSGPCTGLGLLVDPGNGNPDASIMIGKMYGTETCPPGGTAMPPGDPLPTPVVDVVLQWVEDGAPLD